MKEQEAPKKKTTKEQELELIKELINNVTKINDRLRIIEERVHRNREKIRVVDENLIIKVNYLKNSTKNTNLKAIELNKRVEEITDSLQRMLKTLAETARISDLAVIEKVLDLFDPTRYLTEKDVLKVINKELGTRSVK